MVDLESLYVMQSSRISSLEIRDLREKEISLKELREKNSSLFLTFSDIKDSNNLSLSDKEIAQKNALESQ